MMSKQMWEGTLQGGKGRWSEFLIRKINLFHKFGGSGGGHVYCARCGTTKKIKTWSLPWRSLESRVGSGRERRGRGRRERLLRE